MQGPTACSISQAWAWKRARGNFSKFPAWSQCRCVLMTLVTFSAFTPSAARPSVGQRRKSWPRAAQVAWSAPLSIRMAWPSRTAAQTKKSIGIGPSWASPGAVMNWSRARRRGLVA